VRTVGKNPQLQVGDQIFDTRLDFWLCPTHGLFVPSRFDPEWNDDFGCPVIQSDEETCDQTLVPAYLDSLVPKQVGEDR
jgi:hypothetical protein